MPEDGFPDVVLYHGTCRRSWSEVKDGPSDLYVSSSIEDAKLYGYEAAEGDEYLGLSPEPLLVTISPEDLRRMLAGGVTLEPDWGWVSGMESWAASRGEAFDGACWQESLAACHGICLSGFTDGLKQGMSVTALEVHSPDPATP